MDNEEKKIRRIGVLTSGGDAPGMNAAVRAVVRMARYKGIECIGIRRGYNGLINGDIVEMNSTSVNGLIVRGGTFLYTARCPEFMTKEGQERAITTCRYLGLDGIIGIGGDGTFRGLADLSEFGVSCIGIPATIDNDIGCTHYTIGFDTACNTAIDSIDKLRDTMQSHERCSIVEVMGRNAGHLALYVGIACGATAVLVPEKANDIENDVVEKIRKARIRGRTHFIIIVAEGVGNVMEISDKVKELTGLEPRVTILGHVQRGGSPTARDRVTASRMGVHAVQALIDGKKNRIVSIIGGEMLDVDLVEGIHVKKDLQESMYQAAVMLTQ